MVDRSVAARAWGVSSELQAGVVVGGKVGQAHLDRKCSEQRFSESDRASSGAHQDCMRLLWAQREAAWGYCGSLLRSSQRWPHVRRLVVRKQEKGSGLDNMDVSEATCYSVLGVWRQGLSTGYMRVRCATGAEQSIGRAGARPVS